MGVVDGREMEEYMMYFIFFCITFVNQRLPVKIY